MSVTVTTTRPRADYLAFLARAAGAAPRAALTVGHAIAHDAVFEPPTPPIKWGVLRGSVAVEQIGDAARVSFRTAYALRLHETSERDAADWPSRSIDPRSGPKYLELKLYRNAEKYNEIAAAAMRGAL